MNIFTRMSQWMDRHPWVIVIFILSAIAFHAMDSSTHQEFIELEIDRLINFKQAGPRFTAEQGADVEQRLMLLYEKLGLEYGDPVVDLSAYPPTASGQ